MARPGRQYNEYARREPTREPYELVLIVCEGTKTEPAYFKSLRRLERLSNANIRITPADGTDPVSIVRFAESLAQDYDRIYSVFDRNGHANYDAALFYVAQSQLGRAGKHIVVPSWPCFELWLLLHFRYSAAAIVPTGNKSAGDKAFEELKQHFPAYQKGYRTAYEYLLPRLGVAMTRARRLQIDNARTRTQNPSTRVHELVEHLRGLKG